VALECFFFPFFLFFSPHEMFNSLCLFFCLFVCLFVFLIGKRVSRKELFRLTKFRLLILVKKIYFLAKIKWNLLICSQRRPRVFSPEPVFSTPRDLVPWDPLLRRPGFRPCVFHLALHIQGVLRLQRLTSFKTRRKEKNFMRVTTD